MTVQRILNPKIMKSPISISATPAPGGDVGRTRMKKIHQVVFVVHLYRQDLVGELDSVASVYQSDAVEDAHDRYLQPIHPTKFIEPKLSTEKQPVKRIVARTEKQQHDYFSEIIRVSEHINPESKTGIDEKDEGYQGRHLRQHPRKVSSYRREKAEIGRLRPEQGIGAKVPVPRWHCSSPRR